MPKKQPNKTNIMSISITPEGVVFKDGEELGIIEGDKMLQNCSISGVVKGQIRKEANNPALQFELKPNGLTIEKLQTARAMLLEETPPEYVEVPIKPITLEELKAMAAAHGLAISIPSEPIPVVNPDFVVQEGRPPRPALAELMEKAQRGEIPYPPQMGAGGDKTPAFVKWFKEHATEEQFNAQYQGRRYKLEEVKPASTRLPNESAE